MNDLSNRSPAGMRYRRSKSLLTPIIVISNIFEARSESAVDILEREDGDHVHEH